MSVKNLSLKIWLEITLTCFVLQSAVMAQCDSGYVDINGNCYWEQDIQFLNDLIANSNLNIGPLDLGTQTWTNGRLTYFYTVDSDLIGEVPVSIGNLNELTYFYSYGNKFTGSIPDTVKNLSSLKTFAIEYSDITGPIPESVSKILNLENLSLIGNQLSGAIPEEISNLKNLTQLTLSWNDFTGGIPSTIGTLSNLRSLDLSGNDLSGSIPTELGSITGLENLWLGDNELSGDIPISIGNLAKLRGLRLSNNQFSGEIPSWVFNLTNFEILELNGNSFSGDIPKEIGNLKKMVSLDLSYNQFSGSIPVEIGDLTNLTWSLSLNNNLLTGSIPSEIGNLIILERLFLSYNQFSGEIPTEIGELDSLKALWLNDNQLSGQVPETLCALNLTWGNHNNWDISTIYNNQLCPSYPDVLYPTCIADYMGTQGNCNYEQYNGALYLKTDLQFLEDMISNSNLSIEPIKLGSQQWKDTRLTHLSLSGMSMGQSLKGEIPQSVGNLTKLESLKSDKNKFTGTIPDTMKHLTELTHLKITNGKLSGEIPQIIGNLKKLEKLELYLNNFTGSIPDTITTLTKLTILNLGSNQFNDSIPKTIGNLTKLNILGLSNAGLIGKIPSGIGNLGNLNVLWLNNNSLSGTIPDSITSLRNLTYLRLDNNQLTGSIPEAIGNLSKLEIMGLQYNQLSGEIPPGIGNLGSLKQLWLRGNQLTGSIPETIGNLNSLNYLYLRDNQLTGSIPETIGNLNSLTTLSLSDNQLTGSIPETIGNLSSLISLWLDNNQLIGPIPDAIGNLNSITNIYLMNNQLTGTIPEAIGNLTNLKRLFLYSNQVTGIIPEAIGDLKNLNTLYLSNNALTGEIPITIGDLPKLTGLILTSNQLSGTIPEALGNLTKLTVLELLDNKLSGAIPDTIGNLTNLRHLILGINKFSGTIPEAIGNLTDLTHLELGSNKLTGKIPKAIGNLTKLASLKLSKNQLRGLVPTSLCNLSSLQTIELNDNNLCPSYPECLDASSIGTQDKSKCHFPDIYDISPAEPVPGQMVTLTGINFGSPFATTTVNYYQNENVNEGFLFKEPSIETELFVRIPSGIDTGICTTRVAVMGDSLLTSWPFTFNLKSIPDAPITREVYKNLESDWTAVNTITAEDTILVSAYGVDTVGWSVFLSKDGKTLQGTNLGTKTDSLFGIAPQLIVPTGLGTGKVDIIMFTEVNGIGSESSDTLVINYIDNFVFVNASNIGGPWLGTEESPFNEIQTGINAVSKSGTVLVSDGTYLENINFMGKGIKLGSLYMTTGDPTHIYSTIIDGNKNGSVVSFVNNEDTSSVLSGFTIQNGSGTSINDAQTHGGGIYCKGSSPTLNNLNIINNTATNWGGGINCSLLSHPVISNVVLKGNRTLDDVDGQGGGIYCWFSAPQLTNILIVNNSAVYGGGVYMGQEGAGAKFNHVTIADNQSTYGGGLYLDLFNGQFTNKPTILNSIIWNNMPQQIYFSGDNNPWEIDISYSILEGGQDSVKTNDNATIHWGDGNITDSPIFLSNYHLDPYSPAIGAGLPSGTPSTDLNGDLRPNPEGSIPDIGAYESVRALRLLRTTAILDGLDEKDLVLWNDSTSLSAHWRKFENNPSVIYEFAIGTFSENNIAEWQSVGSDTSATASGLKLSHDSTYFFHVRGVDDMGRESKVSSSNGVLIDIVPPSVLSASEEWTSVNPIIGDLVVELDLSEPVVEGVINLTSARNDRYKIEYKLVEQKKYDITISGPFTGGDDISINVLGLKDRAGTVAEDDVFTFPVGYLGDYNVDGSVDASDLTKLVTGWQSKDLQYELGPTTGNVPFLKPIVDGKFDIYDAAAFTLMWHWNLNKSGKEQIPLANLGKELNYIIESSNLKIQLDANISSVDFNLVYPQLNVSIVNSGTPDSNKDIIISHIDTLNGEYNFIAGYLEPGIHSINVPYIVNGKKDVSVSAFYRMFNANGKIVNQGSKEIILKPVPKEFSLHQNYPNPFNPITTINFDLPKQTFVDIVIYDIMGREVVKLVSEEMSAGYQSIRWNTRNKIYKSVSAGIYFYQLQSKDFTKTRKMIILK